MRTLFISGLSCFLIGCGGGGGGGGDRFVVPVADTRRVVEGQFAYFVTGPDLSGLDADGRLIPLQGLVIPTLPRRGPRIPIEIVGTDGSVLATGRTDENGKYRITVNFGNGVPATRVSVRSIARLDLPFGTKVRVLRDASSFAPYMHETGLTGDPTQEEMHIDHSVALGDGAGAYHICDILYEGFIAAKSGVLGNMRDLDVLWEPGNGETSRLVANASTAQITIAGGILGDNTSNTDVWDESIIMRMLGEYLLFFFFADVAPEGGIPNGLAVPSLAWREGFLDFWSCAGRNNQRFWDTRGSGAQGRVVRYFDIESFFDGALARLGPDDPNAYQDAAAVGIGSHFSVAEILWDIHDPDLPGPTGLGDGDGVTFPLFLTLRFLERFNRGTSYPYILSLFNAYTGDQALDPVTLDILTRIPEDQGIELPATVENNEVWPPPFLDPGGEAGDPIAAPYDNTLSDVLDTDDPVMVNGIASERYFTFRLAAEATVTVNVISAETLIMDFLTLDNQVLATSAIGTIILPLLEPNSYVIRVRPGSAAPQMTAFDLRVRLQ